MIELEWPCIAPVVSVSQVFNSAAREQRLRLPSRRCPNATFSTHQDSDRTEYGVRSISPYIPLRLWPTWSPVFRYQSLGRPRIKRSRSDWMDAAAAWGNEIIPALTTRGPRVMQIPIQVQKLDQSSALDGTTSMCLFPRRNKGVEQSSAMVT